MKKIATILLAVSMSCISVVDVIASSAVQEQPVSIVSQSSLRGGTYKTTARVTAIRSNPWGDIIEFIPGGHRVEILYWTSGWPYIRWIEGGTRGYVSYSDLK